ncbi:hypothetical protein DE146DRAFT_126051 [Phaeosphaeria sp. MPI-PUGE-AT-0046c]|nr:hypothetical protein DE146DRAFT_126051 [Phaeosphaeria sp. MPI-PUGE-AT-0046c]
MSTQPLIVFWLGTIPASYTYHAMPMQLRIGTLWPNVDGATGMPFLFGAALSRTISSVCHWRNSVFEGCYSETSHRTSRSQRHDHGQIRCRQSGTDMGGDDALPRGFRICNYIRVPVCVYMFCHGQGRGCI